LAHNTEPYKYEALEIFDNELFGLAGYVLTVKNDLASRKYEHW
jgi:hypothetical protein